MGHYTTAVCQNWPLQGKWASMMENWATDMDAIIVAKQATPPYARELMDAEIQSQEVYEILHCQKDSDGTTELTTCSRFGLIGLGSGLELL